MKQLRALLLNPYIYDFAAYNFWSSPLGLLYIGSVLRKNGVDISLIDCMRVVETKRKEDGRAPFVKEKVDRFGFLKGIKKRLRRYGISPETLRQELSMLEKPELVLITSVMTYWYLGAKEVLEIAREMFPDAKIVVGGIYPSLCYDHAALHMSKADLIVRNSEIGRFYDFVEKSLSRPLTFRPSMYDLEGLPYPCYDLYDTIPFVPLLTSYGCMYRCAYCATPYMHPNIVRREAQSALDEVIHWRYHGVKRYVIYDDNFLFKKDLYAKPLLKGIAGLPFSISIYNPNAINASLINEELARLLLAAGFKEVRIGLESIDPHVQKTTGGKVALKSFERALGFLSKAGFTMNTVGVYILAGLPFQRWEEVKNAIDYLSDLGVKTNIAEYTPIPHTPLFDQFKVSARYPVEEDPIYQNNALFPFAWDGFKEEDLIFLKRYAREKNAAL